MKYRIFPRGNLMLTSLEWNLQNSAERFEGDEAVISLVSIEAGARAGFPIAA
jgi:hypothetical protein